MREGFTVRLARSKTSVYVPPGHSILSALLARGIDAPYDCGAGICGACEVGVLSGTPDHRDFVLNEARRASGKSILICCSWALTPEIELDL